MKLLNFSSFLLGWSLVIPLSAFAADHTETPTPRPTPVPALSVKAKAEIASLRKMVKSIVAAGKAKKLKERTQHMGEDDSWSSDFDLCTDSKGRIRAYFVSFGDGDMAVSNDCYYDLEGNLRVVDHHFGHAVYGSQDQLVFLDDKGAILRVYVTGEVKHFSEKEGEDDKLIAEMVDEERMEPKEGPYTDHVDLVKDPVEDFTRQATPEKKK